LEHSERGDERRSGATRAARRDLRLADDERVVEILHRHGPLEGPAADRLAPLELVDRHIHAGVVELRQRTVEALLRDEPLDVAELDSGVLEERTVGAAGAREDGAAYDVEEARLPLLH